MVKTITPRGVGRPDNEKEVYRSAIPTPMNQIPYSFSKDFTVEHTNNIDFTPELQPGYNLIIRKIIVSAHQNVLIGVGVVIKGKGIYISNGLAYKLLEIPMYPGYVNKGETIEIIVQNFNYPSEIISCSLTILGILEYVGE